MACIPKLRGRVKPRQYNKVKSINYFRSNAPAKQLYYDTAVTSIGKCFFCKKDIPKGTPVLWFWAKFKKYKPKIKDTKREATDLNIKRKICFRCVEGEVFKNILHNYNEEIKKIHQLNKRFKRTIKGKRCKRTIENSMILEELQKEDFTKNFDTKLFHP